MKHIIYITFNKYKKWFLQFELLRDQDLQVGWLLALEWNIPDIVDLFTLSHHILVSVCQVYNGGSAFYVGQSVGDGVFLDAGVVHRPRTLPRHQQAGEVVRRRLDVLRLWTAHWQKEKKNFVYRWFTQKHQ